jgi:hypothetical protein
MTCPLSCFKLYNGHERSLDVTPERKSRSLYLQFQKRNCKHHQKSVFGSQSSCGGSNSGSPERHPFLFHVADFFKVFSLYPTTCLSCLPFFARISRQYLCHALNERHTVIRVEKRRWVSPVGLTMRKRGVCIDYIVS